MADLSIYFKPLELNTEFNEKSFWNKIDANVQYFPEITSEVDIAIFGVTEDRGALNNKGCGRAPNVIREELYKLFPINGNEKIIDLGNIEPGNTIEDTYFAVSNVVSELVKKGIVPLIIGGSQDLTYSNYLGYEKLEQTVNVVTIDSKFDLGDIEGPLNSDSYLGKIILHQPNYLFNYSNLGNQTYFTDNSISDLFDQLYFDTYRLGECRGNLQNTEPIIRNADILSLDVGSIRFSDAPGNKNVSPHGFYGEEACQLARYAGMSDKLSSFGIYEYNPSLDNRNQTAQLSAHILWHFIEGFYSRKKDVPVGTKKNYTKFVVPLESEDHELVFYKSPASGRWWMDVPYPSAKKIRFERHHMVPCSYDDYQLALKSEMPNLWWKTFQKLG